MQRLKRFGIFAAALLAGLTPVQLRAESEHFDASVNVELVTTLDQGAPDVAVIVHLDAPPAALASLDPLSHDGDNARLAVNESIVRQSIATFSDQLDARDLRNLRPFRLQPAFAAVVTRLGLEALARDPRVVSVVPDRVFSSHTVEGLEMIGAVDLHQMGISGAGTAVAIIDTGIDYLHPTLGGGPIPNPKIVRGLDTGDGDDDPMDCGAHGTAVAAVAAGTSYQWNPQQRFAGGVAPQARIFAYKASPDANCGAFTESAVILAMEDAILHRNGDGYRLAAINLSFGTGLYVGPCDSFTPAIAAAVTAATQAGIAVVASAGNQGNETAIASPACIADAIAVGSVWDQDSGFLAYSFCLDEDCTTTCNDSYRPAGSVSCYSNSGAVLDLLAPAEYLKTARAGGTLIEFGGTSGAAAYVTGAAALIQQAVPDNVSSANRRLLNVSGIPTLDQRNGRVRPRLDLPRAMELADRVRSADETGIEIPNTGTASVESVTRVDQDGIVGSVQVLLHLAHPTPDQLVITLQSPDGTEVRLHDRSPDTVGGLGESTPRSAGVWGLYPDELQPAESLGAFGGTEMAGEWRLVITDVVPGDPDLVGTLAGWAISIQPSEPMALGGADLVTLPVVAHTEGEFDAPWVTDVRIFNPGGDPASFGRLFFVPHPSLESDHTLQTDIALPRGFILDLPDVVARRFAQDQSRGALHLQIDDPDVVMTSRTYTFDQESGSFGQYIGQVQSSGAISAGDPPLVLTHLEDSESFRTNLGFTELSGEPVTLRVSLFDGESGLQSRPPRLMTVEGFANRQIRLELPESDGSTYATIEVADGQGRATAYVSVVDNRTGDAVFVPGAPAVPTGSLTIPVVAKQLGHAGTDWRTALAIVNLEDRDAALELEFRPRQGTSGALQNAQLQLGPRSSWRVEDALEHLFGLTQAVGSLRIVANGDAPSMIASARVYNNTDSGTYGQFVNGVLDGVGPAASAIHLDSSGPQRTNAGVCEVGGAPVQVRCMVLDSVGRLLGSPILLDLDPHQLVQINDIFAATESPATANARMTCESVSGSDSWVAYASVIDNRTGDAIFIPARGILE